MSWFDKPFNLNVDPDHRQDKSNGECQTQPMTDDDWKKYGPKSDKKRTGLVIRQSDSLRSLEHRRAKKREEMQ